MISPAMQRVFKTRWHLQNKRYTYIYLSPDGHTRDIDWQQLVLTTVLMTVDYGHI